MKIHLAGTTVTNPLEQLKLQTLFQRGQKLHSYFHCCAEDGFEYNWYNMNKKNKVPLFLDSGAFSAYTQGVTIDIQKYIEFIKENEKHLEVYANLDAIGDPKKTWENQKTMEAAGLHPLPCFHYGEDMKWLKRYLKKYDYIALGGMVPVSTPQLAKWLDTLFSTYLCDSKGVSTVKIHGFGLTSLKLLLRYPWYSVDSTSWVVTGRMGSVLIPKNRNNQWDYSVDPYKINMSSRSPTKKKGEHITALSPSLKKTVLKYIKEKGHILGNSIFRKEQEKYTLQDNEKWGGKASNGFRLVEVIEEEGLTNAYRFRDEINIEYFLELEKHLPKWPSIFKVKPKKGLGF